jgi:hypothetical protein
MGLFQAKTYSGIAATLFLSLLIPSTTHAADLVFGANEQVVYSTNFQNANGLVFENGTETNPSSLPVPGGIGIVNSTVNGASVSELHGASDCYFCKATTHFGSRLSLDNGDINAYFSFRSIPNSQDGGVAYLKLNLTDDPTRIEQLNLTLQIRPDSEFGFYNVLVNPGFGIPKPNTQALQPPAGQFPDTQTYESYRLQVHKLDADTIQVTPYWFDKTSTTWQPLFAKTGSTVPLVASIDTELEGLFSFSSAEIQFFNDVPYANAFAVTQAITPVPEPSLYLVNLSLGLVGGIAVFKNRSKSAKS